MNGRLADWQMAGFQDLTDNFFWCTLILGQQSKEVDVWDGGEGREGWEVAQKI